MRVSTQFPLAVHALLMIAYFPQIRITSNIVAESAGCNAVVIRNIFTKLKKAGLLSVKTGTGGTALARLAEEISLWDVYTAVESDATDELFKMHQNTSGSCPVGSSIRSLLTSHLDDAVAAMKVSLSAVNLEQLKEELFSPNELNGTS